MKVINFFGGPGCGKSTMAAALFAHMKTHKKKCELVTEFAKDLVWENQHIALDNQVYILGCQLQRLFRLKGAVDFILTDSPILLSSYYWKGKDSPLYTKFNDLTISLFNEYDNINILLTRTKDYIQYGRLQTLEEAKGIDTDIKNILVNENIPYIECEGSITQVPSLYEKIM